MKKIFMLMLVFVSLLFSSCSSKRSVDTAKNDLLNYVSSIESYEAKCTMEVTNDGNTVNFNVDVSYLTPDYYKVTFSSGNNHEQIIVKNKTGVFVLTPSLNKQFQFSSDWPLNSSHCYLLNSICKDITNDTDVKVSEDSNAFIVEGKVNHKTNQNLSYLKLWFSKDTLNPIQSVYYDSKDNQVIKVTFNEFKVDVGLKDSDFNEAAIMNEKTTALGEGKMEKVAGKVQSTYEIEGATLVASSYGEELSILCYGGNISYMIIVQNACIEDTITSARIYTDAAIINNGICAINNGVITYYYLDKEISVVSSCLEVSELVKIASGIVFIEE